MERPMTAAGGNKVRELETELRNEQKINVFKPGEESYKTLVNGFKLHR